MKKIMAVILTAAIIFGFAACSPSTVSYFGKDVLSITVASAPDLFEGETLNPADVQLRVVYDDHTEEMFTGAQLGMSRAKWTTGSDSPFKMAAGDNEFTVYYGVKTENDVIVSKESPITIKTVELSELVIDGSAVTTVSSLTDITDGIVLTAYYNEGTNYKPISLAIANGLFEEEGGLIAQLDFPKVEGTEDQHEVKAKANTKVKVEPKWVVTIVDDSAVITGVKVVMDDSVKIFNVKGVKTPQTLADVKGKVYAVKSDNTDDELLFTYVASYKSGETTITPTPATSGDKSYSLEYTEDSVNFKFDGSSTSTTFDFPVKVTITEGDKKQEFASSIEVVTTEDYATDIKASQKTSIESIKQGETIDVDDFDFVATAWASTVEYDEDIPLYPSDGISIDTKKTTDELTVEYGNKSGERTVWFTYDANPDLSFSATIKVEVTSTPVTGD